MNGAEPIGYLDIGVWAWLLRRHPQPHEVTALMALDRAHLFPAPMKLAESDV
jgi:hypothetical protein